MAAPTVYGAAYSVYVRAVRMALVEKGVDHRLESVDIFAPGGPPPEYLSRHPFGKIPALEHNGFRLYETGAITRYVDEAFGGPPLQPSDIRARSRMNQAISIQDAYVYPDLVWGVAVERMEARRRERAADEARIAALIPRVRTCLGALEALVDDAWLAGPQLTLADVHAAPMFDLFLRTPEGRALLPRHPRLATWWIAVSQRASFVTTRP